ncbi:FG-GAP-like repeat-containing protein [Lacinutrix undariae]
MRKKYFLLALLVSTLAYSQQFNQFAENSVDGILYGEALWIDIDNDGPKELFVTGYDEDYNNFTELYVWENEALVLSENDFEAFGTSTVAQFDYNSDGYMDLIVVGNGEDDSSKTNLYVNNTDGTFTESTLIIPGGTTGRVKAADLNNDGLQDLIISGVVDYEYATTLYLQNTLGEFIETTAPFFGTSYGSITIFDANGDTFEDVLITGFSNSYAPESKLYINDGAAVFTASTTEIEGVYFSGAATGDVDNDGDLDVLITGFNTGYKPFSAMYLNDSNGNFTPQAENAVFKDLYFGTSNLVDYDNDNDLDVFITGTDVDNNVFAIMYKNNNGAFTEETEVTQIFQGSYISSVSWDDFDNDGDLDAVVTGLNSAMSAKTNVYENNLETLGLDSLQTITSISVYPNPVASKITINTTQPIDGVNMIEVSGKHIAITIDSNNQIDVSQLAEGTYFLQIQSGNQSTVHKVLVKK